jgi:hypothetical protein
LGDGLFVVRITHPVSPATKKRRRRREPTMSTNTGNDIGKRYVALCKEGQYDKCLDELFSKDAVSVEALDPPNGSRTVKGLDAIHAKGKEWGENHIIHKVDVTGPFPNADRFIVRFTFEVTNKKSNQRITLDEMGLFTIENGKITREEFFYSM